MASKWGPSSPRPIFVTSAKTAQGDPSRINYVWYREQYEHIIVGYLRDGNMEQLVTRARAAIVNLVSRKLGEVSGRYSCWKIIEKVMGNLVKGVFYFTEAFTPGLLLTSLL